MLKDAQLRGADEALARYGIKSADLGEWAQRAGKGAWSSLKEMPGAAWQGIKESPRAMLHGLTGSPAARQQLYEGKAFAPGGAMHMSNVLWPTTGHPAFKWLGRLGTILPALEAYSALRGRTGDPHEGRLTNALGSVGQALGNAYGFPVGGALGSGVLSTLGRRIGTGLGRTLGSKADAPAPPPPRYYPPPQMTGDFGPWA